VFAYGQTFTIDEAIVENMKYISGKIASGTRVVILNIESENQNLSDYIDIESGMFIMNKTKLTLMSKNNLPNILRRKNIKNLDEIDESTALEIGKELGASEVIFGDISKLGEIYRFRVHALGVAYGEVRGMQSLNVKMDEVLADLTGTIYKPDTKPAPQTSTTAKRDAEFDDLANLRKSGGFGDSQSAQAKLEAETNDRNNYENPQIAQNEIETQTETYDSQTSASSPLNATKQTSGSDKKTEAKSRFLVSFKAQIYSVKFAQESDYFLTQYSEQTVKVPAYSFEMGIVTKDGFRYNAIFDNGKGNVGYGVYFGKTTSGKVFRFNGGMDLGLWKVSAQSLEKITDATAYGRVKQNLLFGGPRIGFMLGYDFVFLDFNMKYYLGTFGMHDMTEYNYESMSGFWENFQRAHNNGFSAIYLWNIGLTFTF
jgi:hypothetical protein